MAGARAEAGGTAAGGWRREGLEVDIPAAGCPAQQLELWASPGERTDPTTTYYRRLSLTRAPASGSDASLL